MPAWSRRITWGKIRARERYPPVAVSYSAAVELALKMLETAAEYDTATGGYRSRARIFPLVMRLDRTGIALIPEADLEAHYQSLGRISD